MDKKNFNIQEAMDLLEFPVSDWPLQRGKSFPQVVADMEIFRKRVSIRRKELAKKLHPDRPNSTQKEMERLQRINNVVDLINGIIIKEVPPAPQMRVHIIRTSVHTNSTRTWANSSSSGWG